MLYETNILISNKLISREFLFPFYDISKIHSFVLFDESLYNCQTMYLIYLIYS